MPDKDTSDQVENITSEVEDPSGTPSEVDEEPTADLSQSMPGLFRHIDARCPYLGLAVDRDSRLSDPHTVHRCFADDQPTEILLEHQAGYCFSQKHQTCPRFARPVPFVEPFPEQTTFTITAPPVPKDAFQESATFAWWRVMLWLLVGLLVVFTATYYFLIIPQENSVVDLPAQDIVIPSPSPTPPRELPTRLPPAETMDSGGLTASLASLASPTATATPGSDVSVFALSPAAADVGWLTSGEERGNHFGDSYLYAGILQGQVYYSAFQIDLGTIPRGAPIYRATIQLTGLRDEFLSVRSDRSGAAGAWALRMLAPEIDQNWRRHSYQDIFNAPALQTLSPILGDNVLDEGKSNIFELSAEQIRILETRIIDDEEPTISFRIDGPLVGPDNLFAWDTGYGPESEGNNVILSLEIGPAPPTPPPYDYVIVTSTPTPENAATAAAVVLQMTADATRIGTATPVPPNVVTETPIPDYLVIVPTPTPENEATAQAQAAQATYEALTTGTPPPIPTNAVTATPVPSATPTPTFTPIIYVVITSTPTPESIYVAATMSAAATVQAQVNGVPTPLPANWATPLVVTSTPTPLNEATAQALAQMATAVAFTTGTPTPTPSNVVTATPTPVSEPMALILSPTPVAPTPTPQSVPPELLGKILFRSNREASNDSSGSTEETWVYAYDPATGDLSRLTDSWPYEVALAREGWSSDLRFRVFTKDAIRYKNVNAGGETIGQREEIPALYTYDNLYNIEEQLTHFGLGIAYGGVWSPVSEQIAFISNDSADDEIWVVNRDGSDLRQLTSSNEEYNAREIGKDTFIPELSKFPTWSPDGQQIVFTSNRTGNQQLWIMNADGSDQRLLLGWDNWTPYNDWEPVWVKYLDPAPIDVK